MTRTICPFLPHSKVSLSVSSGQPRIGFLPKWERARFGFRGSKLHVFVSLLFPRLLPGGCIAQPSEWMDSHCLDRFAQFSQITVG